jgi:hypothetical protein
MSREEKPGAVDASPGNYGVDSHRRTALSESSGWLLNASLACGACAWRTFISRSNSSAKGGKVPEARASLARFYNGTDLQRRWSVPMAGEGKGSG